MPRSDYILPEGAEQEEAQQSPLVLQRFRPSDPAERYGHHLLRRRPLLTVHLVCILLDVGTKPTGTSIYDLWKCKVTRSMRAELY